MATMKHFTIQIPAVITVHVNAETADDVTAEEVADAVGKWATLKNGEDFDSDEFTIIDEEDLDR